MTPHYVAPKMPFGVTRSGLRELVERHVPGARVEEFRWETTSLLGRLAYKLVYATPVLGNNAPSMWTVHFPSS